MPAQLRASRPASRRWAPEREAAAPAQHGAALLRALAAERAACAELRARCADLASALLAASAEPVLAAVREQEGALNRWSEAAEARGAEAVALCRRLGHPGAGAEDAAAALQRVGAFAEAAEVAQRWRDLLAVAADVRQAVARSRVLLQQARVFTAFALRCLATLYADPGGPGVRRGYDDTGLLATPAPRVMDRRG